MKNAIVDLPIRLKGNSGNSLTAVGPRTSIWALSRRHYPGGEVLQGILGGGVPPGSPNPDPISDQIMSFSRLVFRRDL